MSLHASPGAARRRCFDVAIWSVGTAANNDKVFFEGETMKLMQFALVGGAVLTMLGAGASAANEPGIVASATGGYQATYGGGLTRSIEFAALRDANNDVKGQVQFKNLDTGVILHYDVTCLNIEDNVATMSGYLKSSSLADPLPYFWLRVADNGQGQQATDLVSPFVSFDVDVGCFGDVFETFIPINNGNIQVR